MKYRFQVRIDVGKQTERWVDVRVSGAKDPYEYVTRGEAENMARMCYGNDPAIVRVIEVSES